MIDDRPKHRGRPQRDTVISQLQLAVESGEYPAGTPLPTFDQLADYYQVSFSTVGRAIRELTKAGLVETTPTGTFVRRAPVGAHRFGANRLVQVDAIRLRRAGYTWSHIAGCIRERYGFQAMAAMRAAHGWTQRAAAARWNQRWPDQWMVAKKLSYWEAWPKPTGFPPTLGNLLCLAELYECTITDLVDGSDFRHLDKYHGATDERL